MVLALVRARFLWQFPYLERSQGVLDGVPRGPAGPPGPLELAALCSTTTSTPSAPPAASWLCAFRLPCAT
jgi:hypothetical protein